MYGNSITNENFIQEKIRNRLNSMNNCFVQIIIFVFPTSVKKFRFKI